MNDHHARVVRVADVAVFDVTPLTADVAEQVVLPWTQLGIAEARELTDRAYRIPSHDTSQLLVVKTNFITHEAQNALLKLLEEPPATTKFLFVVPADWQALPTLASRLMFIASPEESIVSAAAWKELTSLSVADRFKKIDTRSKGKDTDWMREIKSGLISSLQKGNLETSAFAKERLHFVASHLLTRGASNKMLLEELALTWPARV